MHTLLINKSDLKQQRYGLVYVITSMHIYLLKEKERISVNNTAAAATDPNNRNKKVIFKNGAPFTNCISKIDNTQIDNAEYIDIVMPMYNLIEYSDNYSKTFESLWNVVKKYRL